MHEIFDRVDRPRKELMFSSGDPNDPRLGDYVSAEPGDYAAAHIVILGCPQDEGVRRNHGREGAAEAPDAIRKQFYKLTTYNIKRRILDLGNIQVNGSLEETHTAQTEIVTQLLRDRKRVVVLGGGNDISYADGAAMAEVFGPANWIGVNVDSHLDVRLADERNSGTPYRQLLEEKLLRPEYFYEVGFQTHLCSPIYYEYIRSLNVNRISFDLLRSRSEPDLELRESIRDKFIGHSTSMNTFFGFDLDVVRSADAPGTSAPSPVGLRAGEFLRIVGYAASLANTRMIEFSEVNPKFDVDNRTTKLVGVAMHRFCSVVI